MAILRGTAKTTFPSFDNNNSGAGLLLEKAQETVLSILKGVRDGQFETTYTDDGFENVPGFSTAERNYAGIKQPSKRAVISQRPQATVFITKKMFSSLRNNYDIRFMSESEKLFVRAVKLLFERKVQELSFYEALTHSQQLIDDRGFLNIETASNEFLNSFITLIQRSFDGFSLIAGRQLTLSELVKNVPILNQFSGLIDDLVKLKELNRRSKSNKLTTWIVDPRNPDTMGLGPGVGVIELNSFSNLSCNTTNRNGAKGGATIQIEDPYRLTLITDVDVEIALAEAIAQKNTVSGSVRTIGNDLLVRAEIIDEQLNRRRRGQGKSEVNFEFNSQTSSVDGKFATTGELFTAFTLASLSGTYEVTDLDFAEIRQILTYLDAYYATERASLDIFKVLNNEFSDVRRQLRDEFVGQSIIQDMDVVNIFINSNTRIDTPESNRAFDTSALYGNLQVQGDLLDVSTIHSEWRNIATNLPFSFYLSLRKRDFFRSDGEQTFEGLIKSVNSSYSASSGVYKLSISASDNKEYLDLGQFNLQPSLAQPDGGLYDPLTPFEIEVDPVTGIPVGDLKLLPENDSIGRWLKHEDGFYAGETVEDVGILNDSETKDDKNVKYYLHTSGLAYKWKQGIITETRNHNLSRPINSKGADLADTVNTYGITQFSNTFAGLDSADIISTLVTGRPYNYSSFIRQTLQSGSFSLDNTNGRPRYFNYLFDFLETRSPVYGGFLPAKDKMVDLKTAKEAVEKTKELEQRNKAVNKLLGEIARLEDSVARSPSANLQKLELDQKRGELSRLEASMVQPSSSSGNNNLAGNTEAGGWFGEATELAYETIFGSEPSEDDIFAINSKLKYIVRKKPEEVRYNTAKRYLIVSSQYDQDTEIQAFVRDLRNIGGANNLFTSSFKTARSQCEEVANVIDFEFYADSNGNLVFQPPQYNKTPLSLLLKLIALSKAEGVNYAPKFLINLFSSRIRLTQNEILITELRLFEKLLLLAKNATITDNTVESDGLVLALSQNINKNNSGYDLNIDTLKTLGAQNQELTVSQREAIRSKSGRIDDAFYRDTARQLIIVRNQLNTLRGNVTKIQDVGSVEVIRKAKEEIAANSSAVQRLKIANEINSLNSRRQLLIKTYLRLIDNFAEFNANAADIQIPSSVLAQLKGVTPFSDLPVFPKFMEDLIENDLTNEEGFRSGKRFIINDDTIISMSLNSKPPEFNNVSVVGNSDFVGGQIESSIPKQFWAGATDFDSWRQYGFRSRANDISRADFKNPETQCAPYAVFQLIRQRKEIHSGQVTVVGNEFYKPGDVVYVNNKSMLYYVTNVTHSLSLGNAQYQTTLELAYGHPLGEYIPTPLDVIGKGLLTSYSQAYGSIVGRRSSVPVNQAVHLETLYLQEYENLNPLTISNIQTSFTNSESNKNLIKNVAIKVSERLNRPSELRSRVEIRTYASSNSFVQRSKAETIAKWVRDMLIQSSEEASSDLEGLQVQPLEYSDIKIISGINLNEPSSEADITFRRFPSSYAWSYARANPNNVSQNEIVFGGDLAPSAVLSLLPAIDIFYVIDEPAVGNATEVQI